MGVEEYRFAGSSGLLFRARVGFTLLETIIALSVLLFGLLGVIGLFAIGVRNRLEAQERALAQDLAGQWYEWVRWRLDENAPGQAPRSLTFSDLAGASGDFSRNLNLSGPLYFSPPENPANLPALSCPVYDGFYWQVTSLDLGYKPEWLKEGKEGVAWMPWDQRGDGQSLWDQATGPPPRPLACLELAVGRGGRRYFFTFYFSGTGLDLGGSG